MTLWYTETLSSNENTVTIVSDYIMLKKKGQQQTKHEALPVPLFLKAVGRILIEPIPFRWKFEIEFTYHVFLIVHINPKMIIVGIDDYLK